MKTISSIYSILLILFLLPGCIEVNTTIKVNTDGSGTVEETVFMSNEIIRMIEEFSSSFDSTGTAEEFTLFNESELKERAAKLGEGVEYISGEKITIENKEGYKAIFSFKDINMLIIDQDPTSRIPDNPGAQVEQIKDHLTFKFIKGNNPEIIIDIPSLQKEDEIEKEETESADTMDSDSTDLSQLKYFLKDFGFSLQVLVDGTISSTNATYVEGSNVTLFSINFGELLENVEKLKQLEKSNFQNLQRVKDLLKDIPGIKIETNNPVSIKFN